MTKVEVPSEGVVMCMLKTGMCQTIPTFRFGSVVNIATNLPHRYRGNPDFAITDAFKGNMTKVLPLRGQTSVVISGLQSCGAVIVADMLCGNAAAAHVSGDLQFVDEWCTTLLATKGFTPHLLVVGRGTSGSKTWAEPVLREYAKALKIRNQNAFLMDGCGAMGLTRAGVAFAKKHCEWP
jgi:hypothetical protein